MTRNMKEHLATAAGIKKGIKPQSWMGFGMLHLANNRRASLYWLLYSCSWRCTRGWVGLGVSLFDFGSRLAELLLEIAPGVLATGNGWVVQLVSGFLGCAVRIGGAFLIGKYARGTQFTGLL